MVDFLEKKTGEILDITVDIAAHFDEDPDYERIPPTATIKIPVTQAQSLRAVIEQPGWSTSRRWSRREGLDG